MSNKNNTVNNSCRKTAYIAPVFALVGVVLSIASQSVWKYIEITGKPQQPQKSVNIFVLKPQIFTDKLMGVAAAGLAT